MLESRLRPHRRRPQDAEPRRPRALRARRRGEAVDGPPIRFRHRRSGASGEPRSSWRDSRTASWRSRWTSENVRRVLVQAVAARRPVQPTAREAIELRIDSVRAAISSDDGLDRAATSSQLADVQRRRERTAAIPRSGERVERSVDVDRGRSARRDASPAPRLPRETASSSPVTRDAPSGKIPSSPPCSTTSATRRNERT